MRVVRALDLRGEQFQSLVADALRFQLFHRRQHVIAVVAGAAVAANAKPAIIPVSIIERSRDSLWSFLKNSLECTNDRECVQKTGPAVRLGDELGLRSVPGLLARPARLRQNLFRLQCQYYWMTV